jgi:hypothetical protein
MANEIYHQSNWGSPKKDGWGDSYFNPSATNKLYARSDNYENSNGTDKALASKPDTQSVLMTPTAYSVGSMNSIFPTNGDGNFTFDRSSTATRVNKEGLIETVAIDTPRLDYPLIDGVVQSEPALLLEPSRTNSLRYSNLFTWSSGWAKAAAGTGSAPTVTGNYAISPDGSQNASRLQLDKGSGTTTSDFSYMYQTVSSVGTGSISIWMKSNDSNTYQVALRKLNFIVCDVTPKWQRFELNNQASTNVIQIMLRGNYGTSDSADVLIYGAQLEAGSYATSYIPTSGSSVTRSAETANGAGTSDDFNDSEGVLYAEIAALENGGSSRYIMISDGTTSNRIQIFYSSTSSRIFFEVVDGGVSQVSEYITVSQTELNKVLIKYKQDDFSIYANGFKLETDTSGNTPSGFNELSFDRVGSLNFYGRVKEIAVFKEALTDSELEALTSWDSFNDMATGQLYSIR